MKKIYFILSILFLTPFISFATSGACSSHGGVNCSAGGSYIGKVQCNDGWTNSSVYFSDTSECNNSDSDSCPFYISDENTYNEFKRDYENKINQLKNDNQKFCEDSLKSHQNIIDESYNSCISPRQSIVMSGGGFLLSGDSDCEKERDLKTENNNIKKASCLHNSDDIIFKYQRLSSCMVLEKIIPVKTNDQICQDNFGANVNWGGTKNSDETLNCNCTNGTVWNDGKTKCVEKEINNQVCNKSWANSYWNEEYDTNGEIICDCNKGFTFNNDGTQCILTSIPIKKAESKSTTTPAKETKKTEPKLDKILEESKKETENLTPPMPIQEPVEVKPVQKPSLFRRFTNWFLNLF